MSTLAHSSKSAASLRARPWLGINVASWAPSETLLEALDRLVKAHLLLRGSITGNRATGRVVVAHRIWLEARHESDLRRVAFVAAIKDALADGASQSEIARVLGWPRQRVEKMIGVG